MKALKIIYLIVFNGVGVLLGFLFYIDSTSSYISPRLEAEMTNKYLQGLYGVVQEEKPTSNIQFESNLSVINKDLYLNIPKIGLSEKMFVLPYILKKEDWEKIEEKKIDKDIIDIEVLNFGNLNDGFLIGGHSSGYITDKSPLKNVFNTLDYLSEGDEIELELGGIKHQYRITSKKVMNLNESIKKNGLYIYTCYPVGSNKQRLVIELEPKVF